MKDNKGLILFLAINPFGYIPVLRYIINNFSAWSIKVISNYIKGNYSFSAIAEEKFIDIFPNSSSLSNPSKLQQIKRYAIINTSIIAFLIKNKQNAILYSIDYQVMAFVLMWKIIIPSSKVRIIYHQIEVFEIHLCQGTNLRLLNFFKRNAHKMDLVIVPEKKSFALFTIYN